MKKIIELKLKILAKKILAKYKPEIIGITGSVGKTSTKEAVYTVLAAKLNVRRSAKNYNNEIGVPLTIINADSPGKNIFGWLLVFFKGLKLILFKDKNYPKILVLEMGVDRPGDMQYLNSIVKCKVGVVTRIGPSHLEFFDSVEKIQQEKGLLIKNIKEQGWTILNFDDAKTSELVKESQARVITYGLKEGADLRALEVMFSFEKKKNKKDLKGISFKLSYKGSAVPAMLPNVIGYQGIYAALAAAAVGITYGMHLVEVSKALHNYVLPRGRMNLIKGVKHTQIVDDSYNSSPQSSLAALDIIKKISVSRTSRKFAVLGDMLELGVYTEQGHKEVGEYVTLTGINKLILVGERARDIGRGAKRAGMSSDNIFQFGDSVAAGKFLQERIKEGDLILVKGSQGMRMERIMEEIMAEPLKAKELLVRQSEEWLNR